MIPFRLHRRIPLIRRPFFQRDEALRQCAALQARVNDVECEREILRAEGTRLDEALANARLEAAAQSAALQARVNERDILRAERDRLDEALANARLEAAAQSAALQARVNDVESERDILRAERDRLDEVLANARLEAARLDEALANARLEAARLDEALADARSEAARLDEALANARLEAAATHWEGWCPICEKAAEFRAKQSWWRDHLICQSCPGGSTPRERAIMQVLRTLRPNWRDLRIHESSAIQRGTSVVLQRDCEGYVPTQFWPNIPEGEMHLGTRCENLEHQTFSDESFDVVITQDVMEHLFHPDAATREIYRTLAPGGLYLFTTPVYDGLSKSVRYAALEGGEIRYLKKPEYHGNPVDDAGSLVTFHYAEDLQQSLAEWAPFQVDMIVQNDPRLGIVGEFRHVFACHK